MFTQIIIILISGFVGYGAKYFWDKKFFLYKRKIKAIEKLKKAINLLNKGALLYAQMRNLNFKKIENADEVIKYKIQQTLDDLQTKQTIKQLSNELNSLNIQNDIQPYIPDDIWIILNAYMNIFTTATQFLISTPYCLNFIRIDKMEENIIKTIIPVIPEMEKFIKEEPIIRIFYIEDLIRQKLLKAVEDMLSKKRNYFK